jgi:hypothetical protein
VPSFPNVIGRQKHRLESLYYTIKFLIQPRFTTVSHILHSHAGLKNTFVRVVFQTRKW